MPPAWFPDGKRLLFHSQRFEAGTIMPAAVVVRDLATGQEKVIFQPSSGMEIDDLALSPDGQQVALTLMEKQTRSSLLKVLPVSGGEARELTRTKEPEVIVGDSLSWSSDSRYIVFGKAVNSQELLGGYFPTWTGNPNACDLFARRRTSRLGVGDGFCSQRLF